MPKRRPRVFKGPADNYASPGERIVEYSYPDGTSRTPGGLISFRWDENSRKLVVALYRHDDKVEVHVAAPDALPDGNRVLLGQNETPDVVALAREFVTAPAQPRFDVLLPATTLTHLYYEARKHIEALLAELAGRHERAND